MLFTSQAERGMHITKPACSSTQHLAQPSAGPERQHLPSLTLSDATSSSSGFTSKAPGREKQGYWFFSFLGWILPIIGTGSQGWDYQRWLKMVRVNQSQKRTEKEKLPLCLPVGNNPSSQQNGIFWLVLLSCISGISTLADGFLLKHSTNRACNFKHK